MIISNTCKIRPDHYRVSVSEGRIHLHSVVQDYLWPGVLVVVGFVAENEREIVAECVGRDEQGNRIIRYLVVEKGLVDRSWTFGNFQGLWVRIGTCLVGAWGWGICSIFSFPIVWFLFLLHLFLLSDGNKGQIFHLLYLFFLAFSGVSDYIEWLACNYKNYRKQYKT